MKNVEGYLFVSPIVLLIAAIVMNIASAGIFGSRQMLAARPGGEVRLLATVGAVSLGSATKPGVTSLGNASTPTTVSVGKSLNSATSAASNSAAQTNANGNTATMLGNTTKPATVQLGNAGATTNNSTVSGQTSASTQSLSNTSSSTAAQNSTVSQAASQSSDSNNAAQTAVNTSNSVAANNAVANQPTQQVIQIGGNTPGTIILGNDGTPSTVIVGNAAQTAANTSSSAGNNTSTDQSNTQAVTVGNTVKPATVQVGNTTQPATVLIGSVAQTAANGSDTTTDQSNTQAVTVGNTVKPATVQVGNTTKPATVLIGSVAQTAANGSDTTAGNTQGVTVLGNQTKPETVYIGSVSQAASNTGNTVARDLSSTTTSQSSASGSQVAGSLAATSAAQSQTTQQVTQPAGSVTTSALQINSKTSGVISSANTYPVDSEAQISLSINGAKYLAGLKSSLALGVEFYAQKAGVSTPFYIGTAIFSAQSGLWEYSFDSGSYPNGSYNLLAQVTEKGGVFQSRPVSFSILNAVPESPMAAQTTQQLADAKQQLADLNSKIDQAAIDAKNAILGQASLDQQKTVAVSDNISDLVKVLQTVAQLQDLLSQKQAERDSVAQEIAKLEADLQNMPANASESSRNELVTQLHNAQIKKQDLDSKIIIIQEAIDQKQNEKGDLTSLITGLTKSLQGNAVVGGLNDLETTVTQDEQGAIESLRQLQRDSDGDGLNDYEEIYVYHTDPNNPDTDGDGMLDGDEVAHNHNPLDPNDKFIINYQDPRKVAPRQTDLFKVQTIQSSKLDSGARVIKFSGIGLPDSFVTLYIYSQPLVVVVKTDFQGRWEYTLDKSLDDGSHTVYAAQTNSLGEVVARSQEFVFLKTGDTVMRTTSASDASMASTIQQLESDFGFYTFFTIVLAVCVSLLIIGFVSRLNSSRANG